LSRGCFEAKTAEFSNTCDIIRPLMRKTPEQGGQPQPTIEQQRRERRMFIKGLLVGGGATAVLASLGDLGLNIRQSSQADEATAGINEDLKKARVTPPDPKNLENAQRIDERVHSKPVAERDSVDYSSLVWSEKIRAQQARYNVANQVAREARGAQAPSPARFIGDFVVFATGGSAVTEGVLLPVEPKQAETPTQK
jgi:hypothetical protein